MSVGASMGNRQGENYSEVLAGFRPMENRMETIASACAKIS